jgi:hypothetical protein
MLKRPTAVGLPSLAGSLISDNAALNSFVRLDVNWWVYVSDTMLEMSPLVT